MLTAASLTAAALLAFHYRRNFPRTTAGATLQRALWALLAGLFAIGVPLYLLAWILAPP